MSLSIITKLKHLSFNEKQKTNVYIHIGTQKTGSSSIQHFLTNNRSLLKKHNIIYPDFNEVTSSYLASFFGFGSKQELINFNKTQNKEQQNIFVDERMTKIADKGYDIIISAEAFSSVWFPNVKDRLNEIKTFFKDKNVKIICYLRRQDYYLESSYNQVVKAGYFSGTIQEYINRRKDLGNCDLYSLISLYSKVFGKSNILVKTFEPKIQSEEKIFKDLLEIIGISEFNEFKLPKIKVNRSFSKEMIELIRLIPVEFRLEMHKLLSRVEIGRANDYFLSSPVERIRILEHFSESNKKVAKEFFGRNNETLFEEPWPSADEPWDDSTKEFSTKQFIPILLNIIQNQEKRISVLEKKILH